MQKMCKKVKILDVPATFVKTFPNGNELWKLHTPIGNIGFYILEKK